MKTETLLGKLKGIQTIESVKDSLNIRRNKAVYCIYRLRKQGYVKTKRTSGGKRVYSISFENRMKGTSYYEIINENSPVKITTPAIYKIYGKKPTLEETLVFAVKTGSLRVMLASLALFKKISNWSRLYQLAKQNHIERQIGVLYDLARKIMKTRRMTEKFRSSALFKKNHFSYLIPGLKSKDFKEIENMWKIYLPFNKKDLEAYL